MAAWVRSPWRYCPLRLPEGAPLPLAPPCNRQRPFFVAGERQDLPLLVRAPHCRTIWNCTGCRFCLLAFIGLLLIFSVPPPTSVADAANDSLAAGVHMHMLDPYVLFALAPFPRQGFDLHGVRAHKFIRQVAEHVEPFDAVALVPMVCDGAACTCEQIEQGNIRYSHVG